MIFPRLFVILCMCVLLLVPTKVLNAQNDQIYDVVTCVGILFVLSEHVNHPEQTIWMSTAQNTQEIIRLRIPLPLQEALHILQYVTETRVMFSMFQDPTSLDVWRTKADTCAQDLISLSDLS